MLRQVNIDGVLYKIGDSRFEGDNLAYIQLPESITVGTPLTDLAPIQKALDSTDGSLLYAPSLNVFFAPTASSTPATTRIWASTTGDKGYQLKATLNESGILSSAVVVEAPAGDAHTLLDFTTELVPAFGMGTVTETTNVYTPVTTPAAIAIGEKILHADKPICVCSGGSGTFYNLENDTRTNIMRDDGSMIIGYGFGNTLMHYIIRVFVTIDMATYEMEVIGANMYEPVIAVKDYINLIHASDATTDLYLTTDRALYIAKLVREGVGLGNSGTFLKEHIFDKVKEEAIILPDGDAGLLSIFRTYGGMYVEDGTGHQPIDINVYEKTVSGQNITIGLSIRNLETDDTWPYYYMEADTFYNIPASFAHEAPDTSTEAIAAAKEMYEHKDRIIRPLQDNDGELWAEPEYIYCGTSLAYGDSIVSFQTYQSLYDTIYSGQENDGYPGPILIYFSDDSLTTITGVKMLYSDMPAYGQAGDPNDIWFTLREKTEEAFAAGQDYVSDDLAMAYCKLLRFAGLDKEGLTLHSLGGPNHPQNGKGYTAPIEEYIVSQSGTDLSKYVYKFNDPSVRMIHVDEDFDPDKYDGCPPYNLNVFFDRDTAECLGLTIDGFLEDDCVKVSKEYMEVPTGHASHTCLEASISGTTLNITHKNESHISSVIHVPKSVLFTSDAAFELKFAPNTTIAGSIAYTPDAKIEISKDGLNWTQPTWDENNGISLKADTLNNELGKYSVFIKSDNYINEVDMDTGINKISSFSEVSGSNIEVSGILDAMWDGKSPKGFDAIFMFVEMSNLIRAKDLVFPNKVSIFTCEGMFTGCASLTQPPATLPAEILAVESYAYMFSGCTSLTTPPVLPATTLAESCYDSMFQGCTALTQAPVLPATTLAEVCYQEMFSGCTSLTQPPALPATTLAGYCYAYMFQDCTSLIQTPELPATTMDERCYLSMFQGCTSLTKPVVFPVIEAPAPGTAHLMFGSMFEGCTGIKWATSGTPYIIKTTDSSTTEPASHTSDMFKDNTGDLPETTGTPKLNTTYYLESGGGGTNKKFTVIWTDYAKEHFEESMEPHRWGVLLEGTQMSEAAPWYNVDWFNAIEEDYIIEGDVISADGTINLHATAEYKPDWSSSTEKQFYDSTTKVEYNFQYYPSSGNIYLCVYKY